MLVCIMISIWACLPGECMAWGKKETLTLRCLFVCLFFVLLFVFFFFVFLLFFCLLLLLWFTL